jgi:hypothetical protein
VKRFDPAIVVVKNMFRLRQSFNWFKTEHIFDNRSNRLLGFCQFPPSTGHYEISPFTATELLQDKAVSR